MIFPFEDFESMRFLFSSEEESLDLEFLMLEEENDEIEEKEEEREKEKEEGDFLSLSKLGESKEIETEKEKTEEPELTVLEYLKEQRKIRDLLNPLKTEKVYFKSELWIRCDDCGAVLYLSHLRNNDDLCMGCGHHLKMSSLDRIELLVDEGSWRPLFDQFSSCDPLEFEDYDVYADRTVRSQESTKLLDAIQTGTAFVDSVPIALAVMDFGYMGGSMGSVVGEKLTRLIEYATTKGLCLLVICASGGARMQEGSLSLMQMAKISAALYNYQKRANLPYINILTSPTTGGVTASFGMLADFIFTEPKSIIGFAGRRVIEATIGEILPPNFQTAEYLIERGHVDIKVKRKFVREVLSNLIWALNSGNYKTAGFIDRGLHNGLTHLKEERARRTWQRADEKSLRDLSSYNPNLTDKNLYASLNKRIAELKADGVIFENHKENQSFDLPLSFPFPYTNTKLFQSIQNPKGFLPALNDQDDVSFGETNKLEKLSSDDFDQLAKLSGEFDDHIDIYTVFSLSSTPFVLIKKLHGIGRIEDKQSFPTKGIGTRIIGNEWFSLKNKKKKKIGNNGKATNNLGTAVSGIHDTGLFATWSSLLAIGEREENEIDIDQPEVPIFKLNTIQPIKLGELNLENRGNSYLQDLRRFFITRASNASYLKVLGTFEAVAHLFSSSTVQREEKRCKPVSFAFNFEKDCLLKRFSVLDEAIAFAKAQSLHWRNVYDGDSAPQKLAPFQHPLYRQKEKRFFYFIFEKHLNLLERRRANRLANPENAANERLIKKNAGANATRRAANLEVDIDKDFKEFLAQKAKQARKRKK